MSVESEFQRGLIEKIEKLIPGCIVLKNDANYRQGIPDLSIFYKNRWATLECKKSKDAKHQPNQDWYVDMMNSMSFSAFIYPENEKEVLDALQRTFED